jgi:hypothetical protein
MCAPMRMSGPRGTAAIYQPSAPLHQGMSSGRR